MDKVSEFVEALFSSSHKAEQLEQLHKVSKINSGTLLMFCQLRVWQDLLTGDQIDIVRHKLRTVGVNNVNDLNKAPWTGLSSNWEKLPQVRIMCL